MAVARDADRDVLHQPAPRAAADALRPEPRQIGKVHLIEIDRQIGADLIGARAAPCRASRRCVGGPSSWPGRLTRSVCTVSASGVPDATSAASSKRHVAVADPHLAGAGVQAEPRVARAPGRHRDRTSASPPTGASSAASAASDGAARAITLGVTGDSLARRWVSLAPAASVADSVSRACCSPSARLSSAVPSTPPRGRRVRSISACGACQVTPSCRSTTATRAS